MLFLMTPGRRVLGGSVLSVRSPTSGVCTRVPTLLCPTVSGGSVLSVRSPTSGVCTRVPTLLCPTVSGGSVLSVRSPTSGVCTRVPTLLCPTVSGGSVLSVPSPTSRVCTRVPTLLCPTVSGGSVLSVPSPTSGVCTRVPTLLRAPPPPPTDELCICQYRDSRWYRARIVDVYPPGEEGAPTEYEVFYIDYGKCHKLDIQLISLPPVDRLSAKKEIAFTKKKNEKNEYKFIS